MVTRKLLMLVFQIISILLILFTMPDRESVFDSSHIIYCTIIIFVNSFLFISSVSKSFSSWLRFDSLFILGFLIVHFQIPFLASFGIEPERANWIWVNKLVVNYVVWMSSLAILLWLIGFNLYLCFSRKKDLKHSYFVDFKKLDFIILILFLIFISLVGKDFLGGSYSGTSNWGGGATYLFSILRILLYLRLIYFFINNQDIEISWRNSLNILIKNKIFFFVAVSLLLIFLAAGDRGLIMQMGLISLGGYSIFQKKISIKHFCIIAILGSTLFTVMKFGRTREATNRDSNIVLEGFQNFNESDEPFNPTGELANSIRILNRAIDVVPEEHPYLYGTTIFSNALGVIPFASSTYIELTNLPLMYTSSTYFFTIIAKGNFFESGEGSEIIADLYINFGIYGMFLIILFFGYFVGFVSFDVFNNKSHTLIIIFLFLLASSIYLNRAPFLEPLKNIVWALVIDRFFIKKVYHS